MNQVKGFYKSLDVHDFEGKRLNMYEFHLHKEDGFT